MKRVGSFFPTSRSPSSGTRRCRFFKARCIACHSGEQPTGGLDLRTLRSLLAGSHNGPVIVEGSADASILIRKVAAEAMPPPGTGPPLGDREIARLRRWVDTSRFGIRADSGRRRARDFHGKGSPAGHRTAATVLGISQTGGPARADGARWGARAQRDRLVRARQAGIGRLDFFPRGLERSAHAAGLFRLDRVAAEPRGDRNVCFRPRAPAPTSA